MPDVTYLIVPVFSTLANAAFAVRREVFVLEQAVPEDEEHDAHDMTATHVVAVTDGEVVGTLRLLFLPEHVKIGRVAVRAAYRGRGIARDMMVFAMGEARKRGATRFSLAAQVDKLGFYERLGYTAHGETFLDAGIPHQAMKTY